MSPIRPPRRYRFHDEANLINCTSFDYTSGDRAVQTIDPSVKESSNLVGPFQSAKGCASHCRGLLSHPVGPPCVFDLVVVHHGLRNLNTLGIYEVSLVVPIPIAFSCARKHETQQEENP